MSSLSPEQVENIYRNFRAPIAELNCGEKCSPYNERGVPFCCDTHHVIPAAYLEEWDFLQERTDLWHRWEAQDKELQADLEKQLPQNSVLIACLGHQLCQREYRSIACRAFPFFPYLTREGEFIGLTYYWEYETRCWVISNLQVVSLQYRAEFIAAFERLFELIPGELEIYRYQSSRIRRSFAQKGRSVPLLHRNGQAYKISPRTGRQRKITLEKLPKFGPYLVASQLPFPGES